MALFENKDHLERNVNYYKSWIDIDNERLLQFMEENTPLGVVISSLGKKKFAVIMQARYLSGFEERKSEYQQPGNGDSHSPYERMQKWDDIDNNRLKSLYKQGKNIFQLAKVFHRTPKGVLMHIQEVFTNVEMAELYKTAANYWRSHNLEVKESEEKCDYQKDQEVFLRNNDAIKSLSKTLKTTLKYLDEGHNVTEVSKIRNLSLMTIEEHACKLIELGIEDVTDYVDEDDYNVIASVITKIGLNAPLNDVMTEVEFKFSFADIKYVKADIRGKQKRKGEINKVLPRFSRKIYVASSWKNEFFPSVVVALRKAGHEVYDFRNPGQGKPPFKWQYVDPKYMDWTVQEYRKNLQHPLAEKQFNNDIEAMESCDTCVLVLPCGRSAHTEAGWFSGKGRSVICYMPIYEEADLMYKLFDGVASTLEELINMLSR